MAPAACAPAARDGILDTVVAAATSQECCNFCKAFVGCLAWTRTEPGNCVERLGNTNPGCCFLKAGPRRRRTRAPGDARVAAHCRRPGPCAQTSGYTQQVLPGATSGLLA